jgi:hypothetical protein
MPDVASALQKSCGKLRWPGDNDDFGNVGVISFHYRRMPDLLCVCCSSFLEPQYAYTLRYHSLSLKLRRMPVASLCASLKQAELTQSQLY